MNFEKFNNLLELFNYQYNNQKTNEIFLQSLKNSENKYTWQQVYELIQKLSNKISSIIIKKDRCLLISENRPEWLISDLAIMLSYGITVPAYTTYTKKDYDFLINDCKPSVIIVSNQAQFDKIKDLIVKYNFIKLIISFDVIDSKDTKIYNFKKIFDKKK
jgi:long-chain acyl-CoA synthetase